MFLFVLRLLDGKQEHFDERRELVYTCLYLLIWGEAANLRFMPECLCFIYHHVMSSAPLMMILFLHFMFTLIVGKVLSYFYLNHIHM